MSFDTSVMSCDAPRSPHLERDVGVLGRRRRAAQGCWRVGDLERTSKTTRLIQKVGKYGNHNFRAARGGLELFEGPGRFARVSLGCSGKLGLGYSS